MANTSTPTHTFADEPAVRGWMPTLIGLIGPSSSGKTFSALRLATGFQRVGGGDIFVIDTEAGRSRRYADRFKFRHVDFRPPYSPARYQAVMEYVVGRGAKHVIVDSMSHEHESTGGVLEMHALEVERLSKGDPSKAEGVAQLAWSAPKKERRRMINAFMQMKANFIFCYRAKEKNDHRKGAKLAPLGWMPLGADEMIFEMSLNAILHPLANGYPTWKPTEPGERATVKLPEEYKEIFAGDPQLSEDVGEKMALWAVGTVPPKPMTGPELIAAYMACTDEARLARLQVSRAESWPQIDVKTRELVIAQAAKAKVRIDAATAAAAEEAARRKAQQAAEPEPLTLAPEDGPLTDADRRAIELAERDTAP